ncbi:tRNA (guanosine(46)-N7)-methyltransferase TrmB [Anaerovorax odorimutans]|uniref:tRNA (guanine-N(7)-)-methyltransferase n=1 Tax=Anaerovorax odorimutans TaxID=109327 RepID=A0ABT1RJT2_9FIRM|nr:tRNA (guanosine(46)-N7)-methyltransferase TrmB [Anaerovorax odorimutans]MCQ4635452.1 tRNA (guanosine(46)-N7)-methyltransferase TrmB [Anaerovorax odorimutans]
MRQRKAKNMEERLTALKHYLIETPGEYKGDWHSVFENKGPLYLELGCGKGQFLIGQAQANTDANFIGIEGQDSVLLRALEKTDAAEIVNIRFIHMFVRDIRDLFGDGELSGIYLNFSDPWPKARHAKRRLTYGEYLVRYKQVLREDGFIAVKTDNDGLFDFTLEEIERLGLEIKEMTRDLHSSDYAAREITTEYEDKFRSAGKNINYVLL